MSVLMFFVFFGCLCIGCSNVFFGVFIVLKPLCFKIVGLPFVFLFFVLFLKIVLEKITKALVEVEEKPRTRMRVGSSDSSRRGEWE